MKSVLFNDTKKYGIIIFFIIITIMINHIAIVFLTYYL